MTERRNILIVDDDKSWQAFLSVALRDDYNVIAAYDGYTGLKLAAQWLPDTILLDIEMPIKNGYEVCAALKANPQLRDIPIIFVTLRSSLQEKITGFQLGADDYVVKPCDPELLSVKIARSSMLYREKKALDERAVGAQELAFEAMNSNADLGRSLRFAERTYAMHSVDKLAEGLFQTMAEFGLDTSVMFITECGPQFYAQNRHELSPLEKDMFLAIHQQGRFSDFGCRTFCNFTLVSLLIKNMPLDDPERYGRIKDTVPWILGVMDGKVGSLDFQNALIMQHYAAIGSVQSLKSTINAALQSLAAIEKLPGDELGKMVTYENLVSSLSLLNDMALQQASVDTLIKSSPASSNQTIGQANSEIFSSDVDFF